VFLEKFPTWPAVIANLDVQDQHVALHWLFETFGEVGVSQLPDARADVQAILQLIWDTENSESYHALGQIVNSQLVGRSLVRQVNQLSVFALLGVDESDNHRRQKLAGLMALLLAQTDRSVRTALWEYLAEYLGNSKRDWSQRLQTFRDLVATDERSALRSDRSKSPGRSGKFLGIGERASGWFRDILGRDKP
jgi:hypothetical protein